MKKFFTQTILLLVALLAGTSAKAVSYKIDGPSELTTNAVYSIVTTDGSALPVGLTATWDYPSDFYRIGYTNTTIELGRKTAEGYYTLRATLNNGTSVSKEIHAVKQSSGGGGGTVTPPATQKEIRLELYRFSDMRYSGFSSMSLYTLASKNSFVTTTGDIYVSGSIYNTSSFNSITLDPSRFLVAFGYQESPYSTVFYNGGGEKISSLTIPAHDYADIIIKIPENWTYHLKTTSDNYTYLDMYFIYAEGSGLRLFNGSYCITNSSNKLMAAKDQSAVSVSSNNDLSNVTIKTTDDSSIKSIKVVSTMGNLIKAKSYNGDCREVNLDLSNCQKGIYYIQVEKTTGVETAKIIKK